MRRFLLPLLPPHIHASPTTRALHTHEAGPLGLFALFPRQRRLTATRSRISRRAEYQAPPSAASLHFRSIAPPSCLPCFPPAPKESMSYQQHPHSNNFGLAATFVPGGTDDYYLPPQPELVSPAPQRIMQEDVDQIQNQVAHLELEANGSAYPPRGSSMHSNTPSSSNGSHYKQSDYSQYGKPPGDVPNFSPFPKLVNPPPNIPPTDDEKEQILEIARMGVLNSNDPEMQLAWAQDSLTWVDASMVHAERVYTTSARPPTPAVEHQLRMDAMNIVQFLADQHHPRAEFMRGMWLEFGKFGMRIDKKEAFRCYSRAADKGYWRAEYRIGMLFEQSNDPVKALVHYKRGADAGDSASNYVGPSFWRCKISYC